MPQDSRGRTLKCGAGSLHPAVARRDSEVALFPNGPHLADSFVVQGGHSGTAPPALRAKPGRGDPGLHCDVPILTRADQAVARHGSTGVFLPHQRIPREGRSHCDATLQWQAP